MASMSAATNRRLGNTVYKERKRTSSYYTDGSTVRKMQNLPQQRNRELPQRQQVSKPRKVSKEALRNREKATSMSRGFVLFLAVISAGILFSCVNYLQLKAQITTKANQVAALESDLSELKEDNDAYYSQVAASTDLDKIKKTAIERLGMKYPSDEQIMTYETKRGSYVRQYQDVPEAK